MSRHTFTLAYIDASGARVLTDPDPYRYRDLPDNRVHRVITGDTLYNIARRYFEGYQRPDGLWWVIADFQPEPIHDPTLTLEIGRLIVIPSRRTLEEEIFSERRRSE